MRNLYESILDTNKDVKTGIDVSLLPREILRQLKTVFNEYLERESNITRVSSWYPLGNVDDDLYPRDDIKKAEDFIIHGIKEMHQNIRKNLKKTLISIDTEKYKSSALYYKRYNVEIWIPQYEDAKYTIEFTLRTDIYPSSNIEYIKIWTKNRDLAELLS